MSQTVITGNGAFTLSIQGAGVETPDVTTYPTVGDILREKGISEDTPVNANGVAMMLGDAINAGDIVTVTKPGGGA